MRSILSACRSRPSALLALIAYAGAGMAADESVTWQLDGLDTLGGHDVLVEGDPRVVDTPGGKAIEFDGEDDGLFLDINPLSGLARFTVEVVFRPDRGGLPEQRFVHIQEDGSESRVMIETRLVAESSWFLDTFVRSGEQSVVLYAENAPHTLGTWHHAALVVDGTSMRHYVDGRLELTDTLAFAAQGQGRMSIGVRQNRVHWFKGAIRTLRFTPRALDPEDFLTAAD